MTDSVAEKRNTVCSPRRAHHVFQSLSARKGCQREGPSSRLPGGTHLQRGHGVRNQYHFHFSALANVRRCQKGGFIRDAATHGVALLFPDTSPRGAGIEGEDDDWEFGTGDVTPLSKSPTSRTDGGESRRRVLPQRDESQICTALQHAHACHPRASPGHRGRWHTHRTSSPLRPSTSHS